MAGARQAARAEQATADREIVISRVIDAPRDLVFEAFTQVRHLSRWWGPEGFTTTTQSSVLASQRPEPTLPVMIDMDREPSPVGFGCNIFALLNSHTSLPLMAPWEHCTILTTLPGVKLRQLTVTTWPSTKSLFGSTLANRPVFGGGSGRVTPVPPSDVYRSSARVS